MCEVADDDDAAVLHNKQIVSAVSLYVYVNVNGKLMAMYNVMTITIINNNNIAICDWPITLL